eukprot:6316153-Prymnesium_polylepis.1
MLQRRLATAVVARSDVTFVERFNDKLLRLLPMVPLDAQMFYLGSNGVRKWNTSNSVRPLQMDSQHRNFSANAYVVFKAGALRAVRPIIAKADVMMSDRTMPIFAPSPAYAPTDRIALVSPLTERQNHSERRICTSPDQRLCRVVNMSRLNSISLVSSCLAHPCAHDTGCFASTFLSLYQQSTCMER